MNKKNINDFIEGNHEITFEYTTDGGAGKMTFELSRLPLLPVPSFRILLDTVLKSNQAGEIIERIEDYLSYAEAGNVYKFTETGKYRRAIESKTKKTKKAEPTKEAIKTKTVANMEQTPQIYVEDLTQGNYMTAASLLFSDNKSNFNIIMSAGFEAGVFNLGTLEAYILHGRTPNYHTFQSWKESGYIVKKGEKSKFSANIWKKVSKIDKDGTKKEKFIIQKANFFSYDQVTKLA